MDHTMFAGTSAGETGAALETLISSHAQSLGPLGTVINSDTGDHIVLVASTQRPYSTICQRIWSWYEPATVACGETTKHKGDNSSVLLRCGMIFRLGSNSAPPATGWRGRSTPD